MGFADMKFITAREVQHITWSDCTLVVPAVSIGNVAQLAIDAMITTYGMQKVGYIHDRNVYPVVGNDPCACTKADAKGVMALPVEVFYNEERKLVFIQRRSACIKGGKQAFSEALFHWIQEQSFAKTILLSSIPAFTRNDEMLKGVPFGYLTSDQWQHRHGDIPLELGWPRLPTTPTLQYDVDTNKTKEAAVRVGGGISKSLVSLFKQHNKAILCLSWYASEGDNSNEGLMMADVLDQWFALIQDQERAQGWNVPLAWSNVYGAPSDPFLYN